MFTIINRHEHVFYKKLVDPFLREIKSRSLNLDADFFDPTKTTFILAKENPERINGGAVLLQKKAETLHPLIRERLDVFVPPEQEVWVGSIVLEIKAGISGQDYECFTKIFYRNLYEALIKLGRQERIAFLYMMLSPCEHQTTEHLEYWPYVINVRPKHTSNGLYHSILALTGTRESTAFFWKSLSTITKIKELAE